MLATAIACSAIYIYIWLFELTGNPIHQLAYVMDLAGRAAVITWPIFANIVIRSRAAKKREAEMLAKSMGCGGDGEMRLAG
jgi:hypothetical protein